MRVLNVLHKVKLTITVSPGIAREINNIARKQKHPRSQIIEEMLRNWLKQSKKQTMEKEIEKYYLSLAEKEKAENKEWAKISAKSAKRTWHD